MRDILAFESVSAGSSEAPIVHEISCAFAPGTVSCLIGSNGAGKSTLLKYIFGLVRHLSGRLIYDGRAIEGLDSLARLQRGIALVPQGRCNFQSLSVRENLWLGAYTLSKVAARAAIDRRIAQFPLLERKWSELAGNLSGGEQQILEMTMALLIDPRLLLLDEPSLGLSPRTMSEVFAVIRETAATGVTVVMVEQNVRGALAISDHAIVLDLGRTLFEGAPSAVLADRRIQEAFLGSTSAAAAAPT
jgi:branched-chain amino acid transport system ATP-binding protein